MKNNLKKFVINFLIIIIVLVIVLYFSLRDNYHEIMNSIINMNHFCVVFAILCLCLCRFLFSITHYNVIKLNNENVSLKRCLQINFIILFFHGITPFAGGGQPMEIYYLHNEKIRFTKATNITLQNFIIYQISFVFVSVLALLYNSYFDMFPSDHLIKKLVILGFAINILVLIFTFILSFGKKISAFLCDKIIRIGSDMKIIKDEMKTRDKIKDYLDSFYNNALELSKHKKRVLQLILVDILAIFILYSMPFFIARGFGLDLNIIQVVVTTAYVMTIGSFVPVPGGTGGIEYGFVFFFSYLTRGSVVSAVMLIWRFVSYYLGMIIGAIALSMYRKRDKI